MTIERNLALEFVRDHPQQAALACETLTPAELAALLRELPPELAQSLAVGLSPHLVADALGQVGFERASHIISVAPFAEALAMIRPMASDKRGELLSHLPPALKATLARSLEYRPGTAGALMDPRVPGYSDELTVKDLIQRIRQKPEHMLTYVFLLDEKNRLAGVVGFRELMLADPEQRVQDIMTTKVASLYAGLDQTAIVEHSAWHLYSTLPVVDSEGCYLGALRYKTYQRIRGILERPAGSERARSAGDALGELYWVGLVGLAKAVGSTMSNDHS